MPLLVAKRQLKVPEDISDFEMKQALPAGQDGVEGILGDGGGERELFFNRKTPATSRICVFSATHRVPSKYS